MSYNLSPPDITKKDFLMCVKDLCEEFTDNSKVEFRLSILENTDASFLKKEEILNLYRILQESITNAVKHSKASEIVLLIRNQNENKEKGLYIFISDDGKGFDTERVDGKQHFGLKGMKKRAEIIGVALSVSSEKDYGTQVKIFKPVGHYTDVWEG